MVKEYKQKSNVTMLSKMVIQMLKGNKKVPAGCYALDIPLIIIKKKNNYIPQIHLNLKILRSSRD